MHKLAFRLLVSLGKFNLIPGLYSSSHWGYWGCAFLDGSEFRTSWHPDTLETGTKVGFLATSTGDFVLFVEGEAMVHIERRGDDRRSAICAWRVIGNVKWHCAWFVGASLWGNMDFEGVLIDQSTSWIYWNGVQLPHLNQNTSISRSTSHVRRAKIDRLRPQEVAKKRSLIVRRPLG